MKKQTEVLREQLNEFRKRYNNREDYDDLKGVAQDALANLAVAVVMLERILDVSQGVRCNCSPKEIDSGHQVDCWMPAFETVVNRGHGLFSRDHNGMPTP